MFRTGLGHNQACGAALTRTPMKSELVPLLPPREISFRERGKRTWKRQQFTILGEKSFLEKSRAMRPVHLTLETNVEGFRSVEVVGMDLFLGISSALLSIESLILLLMQSGEVRLPHGEAFNIESDTAFFSSRVTALRESLVTNATRKKANK
jgi:hypothetical protein